VSEEEGEAGVVEDERDGDDAAAEGRRARSSAMSAFESPRNDLELVDDEDDDEAESEVLAVDSDEFSFSSNCDMNAVKAASTSTPDLVTMGLAEGEEEEEPSMARS